MEDDSTLDATEEFGETASPDKIQEGETYYFWSSNFQFYTQGVLLELKEDNCIIGFRVERSELGYIENEIPIDDLCRRIELV